MFASNFLNHDPSHIFYAKYFTQEIVVDGSSGKKYRWNEFMNFQCKPVEPRYNRFTTTNANLQALAPDTVFIETKWSGLPYRVSDYVEYRNVKYIIKSIKKDETRINPQVLLLLKDNPNTYYILELEEVALLDMEENYVTK